MPEYAFWTLIISLAILSFGLSLKLAETSHLLKLANKEIDSFIEQITSLKKDHKEIISSSSEFHDAKIKKISNRYEKHLDRLYEKVDKLSEHRNPPLLGLQGFNYYNKND